MGVLKLKGEYTREDAVERAVTAGLFAAALLIVIQSAKDCEAADDCTVGDTIYALIFGAVTMLLVLIKIINKNKDASNPLFTFLLLPVFLFLWCAVGVFILTFKTGAKFEQAVPGFFATWICGGLSAFYCLKCLNIYFNRDNLINPIIGVVFLTHLSVLASAAQECNGNCSGRTVYAILASLAGGLYLIFLLVVMSVSEDDQGSSVGRLFWLSLVLVIWWAAALIGTTTSEPFLDESVGVLANGFFGVWINFLGSTYMAYDFNARNDDPPISSQGLLLAFVSVFSLISFCQALAGGSFLCFLAEQAQLQETVDKCQSLEQFAVAIGAFGTGFAAIGCILFTFTESGERWAGLVGILLGAIWTLGVGVSTFIVEAPFYTINSGYFAVWGALILSLLFLSNIENPCSNRTSMFDNFTARFKALLWSFLFFGIILLAAAGSVCNTLGECNGENLLAIFAPIISWFLVLLIVIFDACDYIFEYILVLFWIVATAYFTIFKGPFLSAVVAANGFFASWMLTFSAVLLIITPRY